MYSFSVTDFENWRTIARTLLQANVDPSNVSWQPPEQQGLFSPSALEAIIDPAKSVRSSGTHKIPRQFLQRAKQAACFSDMKDPARKWSILYSLLWRIVHYGNGILLLTSDPEVRCLDSMCKAVSRDKHKMKAFVRFQQVANHNVAVTGQECPEDGAEYYVAWFEPSHAIVESVAPFFVKRFTGMHWSILTPGGCAHWDMEQLTVTEGVPKPDIDTDSFDIFWKAYYCNIFNPARLKEQAMRSEMPKKYWKYLPEAACIHDLTRGATAVTEQMIDAPTTNSDRAREKSRIVAQFQNTLRLKNRIDPDTDNFSDTPP